MAFVYCLLFKRSKKPRPFDLFCFVCNVDILHIDVVIFVPRKHSKKQYFSHKTVFLEKVSNSGVEYIAAGAVWFVLSFHPKQLHFCKIVHSLVGLRKIVQECLARLH